MDWRSAFVQCSVCRSGWKYQPICAFAEQSIQGTARFAGTVDANRSAICLLSGMQSRSAGGNYLRTAYSLRLRYGSLYAYRWSMGGAVVFSNSIYAGGDNQRRYTHQH